MLIKQANAQVTLDIAGEAVDQGLYGASQSQGADGGFGVWLGSIMHVVIVIGALACFGFIVLGAIEWITGEGDKNKTEGARNKITGAIIGLLVLSASIAIFNLVARFLGINAIRFI